MQNTWDLERRLKTWANNNNKFKHNQNGTTKKTMDERLAETVERIRSQNSKPLHSEGSEPESFSDYETVIG
jgi:hypothetical protein